jgi:hypothetical protein
MKPTLLQLLQGKAGEAVEEPRGHDCSLVWGGTAIERMGGEVGLQERAVLSREVMQASRRPE